MQYSDLTKVFFICAIMFAIVSCKKENAEVYYNEDIKNIIELAKKKEKSFCIVLLGDSSPISSSYMDKLLKGKSIKKSNVIFNIINTNMIENRWYTQWIGIETHVITCVFSPSGSLQAVITGASSYSFDCIKRAVDDDLSCNRFGYNPLFIGNNSIHEMDALNKILKCKIKLDEGKDISLEIDKTLEIIQYPYNVYLKCLNSQKQGKKEESIYVAKQLLTFDDILYLKIYSDIYNQAKYIINPQYNPNDDAKLLINKNKIELDDCLINKPRYFNVKLTNEGNSLLTINHIDLGCSCVRLIDDSIISIINPNDSVIINLEFTADRIGELEREIVFVSNSVNRIESVKIKALVK